MPEQAQIAPEEEAVMAALGEAYNRFIELPVLHHADLAEFVLTIHAAQNIVLARVGLRSTGVYRPDPPQSTITRE